MSRAGKAHTAVRRLRWPVRTTSGIRIKQLPNGMCIAAYAHLFQELSPPLPENHAHLFSVNGQLLPGYTVQPHQPSPQELLDFLEDGDAPPKKEPKPKKRNHDMTR